MYPRDQRAPISSFCDIEQSFPTEEYTEPNAFKIGCKRIPVKVKYDLRSALSHRILRGTNSSHILVSARRFRENWQKQWHTNVKWVAEIRLCKGAILINWCTLRPQTDEISKLQNKNHASMSHTPKKSCMLHGHVSPSCYASASWWY